MGKSRRRGRNHERLDIEELQKKLELDRTRQIASGGKIAKSTTEDNLLQIEESSPTVMPKVKDKKKENFLQVEKLERVITVKAQKNQYEEFCHSIQGAIHRQKASRAVCCFQLAFGGDGMLKAGFISHDMALLCCRAFAEQHGREFYLYHKRRKAPRFSHGDIRRVHLICVSN